MELTSLTANYDSALGGAVAALTFSSMAVIVPVYPNTSSSTFRTNQGVSRVYNKANFHPTNSKVYLLGTAWDTTIGTYRYGAMWAVTRNSD